MSKTKFQFICHFCLEKFYSKQKRERKFCCIEHFRFWSKGNINKKPLSDERKKKISDYQKTRKRNPNSEQHNKNISASRKGIKFSKEHRKKLSISRLNNNFRGNQQKYISLKTNEINYSHSSYELQMMKKLDEDNNVKYWTKNHKIRIQYLLNGHDHIYIPDFLVVYKNENKEIIEVKGYIYNKEKYEAKNIACKNYCNENNMSFKILFKEDIYG